MVSLEVKIQSCREEIKRVVKERLIVKPKYADDYRRVENIYIGILINKLITYKGQL